MSIEIQVNGLSEEVSQGTTVAQWVAGKGLHPHQVAIELNQELVTRDERESAVLVAGDRIEMVTLVGGG